MAPTVPPFARVRPVCACHNCTMSDTSDGPAARYTQASYQAARQIISRYSTSFSLATRLLPRQTAERISVLYAMVRVADEIVDGAWTSASAAAKVEALRDFETRIDAAVASGFSSDLVVHAFADTAAAAGIDEQMWRPFFASMRADAQPQQHDEASLVAYIHGSAEVVGFMCVRIFTTDTSPTPSELQRMDAGAAALGAAFQRINFLRDLAHDQDELGRGYIVSPGEFDDLAKATEVARIRGLLARADASIGLLPARVRPAVRCAHGLFSALTDELETSTAAHILNHRVRVPARRKLAIAARAVRGSAQERRR